VPPAKLEVVKCQVLDFVPTLEEEILNATPASSDPTASADDSLIGSLAGASLSPRADSAGAAAAAPSPAAVARLPCVDAAREAVAQYESMDAGQPATVRLAVALLGTADAAKVLQFCATFDKCRSVLPDATDAAIAAAALDEADEQAALNSLLSASSSL
jgi:hypothetical protein